MSTRWNSGRLSSISATASPRSTPSAASPAAIRTTRSPYSCQVSETASPGLRSAISSGRWAAVYWNAWTSVGASRASGRPVEMGATWSSIPPTLTGRRHSPQPPPPRNTNPRSRAWPARPRSRRSRARAAARSAAPPGLPGAPTAAAGRACRLLGLGEQIEQDRQLGPVVEIAGDDLERARSEHGQQLVVLEPQQLLEAGRAQRRLTPCRAAVRAPRRPPSVGRWS